MFIWCAKYRHYQFKSLKGQCVRNVFVYSQRPIGNHSDILGNYAKLLHLLDPFPFYGVKMDNKYIAKQQYVSFTIYCVGDYYYLNAYIWLRTFANPIQMKTCLPSIQN